MPAGGKSNFYKVHEIQVSRHYQYSRREDHLEFIQSSHIPRTEHHNRYFHTIKFGVLTKIENLKIHADTLAKLIRLSIGKDTVGKSLL